MYGVPGRKAQSPHSTRYRNNSQGQQRKRGGHKKRKRGWGEPSLGTKALQERRACEASPDLYQPITGHLL